jgi:hypothetical protein
MNKNNSEITKVENINDANVRLTFADGTTLRMGRNAYESGSWKNGTALALVKAVQGVSAAGKAGAKAPARFAVARNGECRRLHRQTSQGKCEKCNTRTWWTVSVAGRQAYWCGCP